jgi:SAM-dependent methyltransferase
MKYQPGLCASGGENASGATVKNIAERLVDVSSHHGPVVVTVDGFDVIDCEFCGFRHIDPLFTTEQLRKFYQSEFYESERPDYFERMEADREWWMLRYHYYYELLEANVPGRRLLDIGSGPGYFLDAGRERGWQVMGFEPSRAAADYARGRGLTVVNDFFSAAKAKEHGLFDVISMSMVLEHVRDPIDLIEEARRLLVPGGLLFVASPNDFNPLQMVLWKKMGFQPWWVNPKHHLNYFDTGSAKSFLAARRFQVLHLETSYPLENFLMAGRNYVGNPALGRECHNERKALESALFRHDKPLIQALAASWAAQGIGREFIILGRKV